MIFLRWLPLLIAFTLLPVPARAWDQKGHRVVAAVAWDHMNSDTRTKAVAILRGAPGDSDLLAEDAGSALPQAARDRELFLRAATIQPEAMAHRILDLFQHYAGDLAGGRADETVEVEGAQLKAKEDRLLRQPAFGYRDRTLVG